MKRQKITGTNWKKLLLIYLALAAVLYGILFNSNSKKKNAAIHPVNTSPTISQTPLITSEWQTITFDNLSFKIPSNWTTHVTGRGCETPQNGCYAMIIKTEAN